MVQRILPEGAAWDGLGVLIAQHRRVDATWQRLDGSAGILSGGRRLALARQLVRLLSIHDGAEELHLYPMVRRALIDGGVLADRALASHHEQAKRLAVLDGTEADEPGFDLGWSELMAEVLRHVQEEEKEIFPRLLRSVDRLTLTLLAPRIERAARMGPTRPHPRVHQSLLMGRVTAPAIGVLDRAKDASRQRAYHEEDKHPPEGTLR